MEQFETPWNVVRLHDDARKQLLAGLKVVAEAVGCTLGPRGRCVLIQTPGQTPVVTKDGVTVSKSIHLRDPAMRAGAELIREAASRTADVAGDGTTTSTVLAYAMASEGMKAMDRNFNANAVKRGIDAAVEAVVEELKKMAKPITSDDELRQIATISANGDSVIGGLIADAVKKVGKTGIVTVDDAKGASTSLEFVEGLQFTGGWMNSFFVTNPEKMQAVMEDCFVLLTDRKISALKELLPILEGLQKTGKPLLVIAEDVEGEALQGLIVNKMKGVVRVCAVKAPGWGSARTAFLEDLAALSGAQLVSAATGVSLEKVTMKDLGVVKRATVDKTSTTLVGAPGNEEHVTKRVKELQGQLEAAEASGGEEKGGLLERIGKLTAGAAVIKVGGMTEIEVREKRDRVDDAICATRAALEEGTVPGGGVALLRACMEIGWSHQLDLLTPDERQGFAIVELACGAPLGKIAYNSGESPAVITTKLKDKWFEGEGPFYGWNAATNEFGDMLQFGILDPVKVSRTALQNAASVAGIFLTLDAAVLEDVKLEGK